MATACWPNTAHTLFMHTRKQHSVHFDVEQFIWGQFIFFDAEQVYTRDILKQEALVISKNVEKTTTTKNTKTHLEPSLNLCYPVSYTKDAHKIISLSS